MRSRLNYANVTATLALFFAMSGGALAARHYLISSTKQISPKVLAALRGRTGRTGATGTQGREGPQGLPGQQGPAGIEGPQGKRGPTGRNGEPGPLVSTLPSGKTLTGSFQASSIAPAETFASAEATISFAFPLAANPTVEAILPGGKATAHCAGSAEAPAATAGYLCLYAAAATEPPILTFNPSGGPGAAGKNGAVAYTQKKCEATPCIAQLFGTWAVTAP